MDTKAEEKYKRLKKNLNKVLNVRYYIFIFIYML